MQKVGFTVEERRILSADNAIKWEHILLVERLQAGNGYYAFTVYFADEKSVTYHQNSPEGTVLHNHWERYAPKLSDDAERIPVR